MTNTKLKNLLQKEMTRKDFLNLSFLLVISAFGVYGVLTKLLSQAASPYATNEAEKGTRSGTTTITNDPTASGGAAVEFGTASTGTGGVLPHVPAGAWNSTAAPSWSDDFPVNAAWASNSGVDPSKWNNTWAGGNGNIVNMSPALSSNVSVDSAGLHLQVDGSGNGACVNTNAQWAANPSMVGWQGAASDGVRMCWEARISLPGSGTTCYNWPAWWGPVPNTVSSQVGEIDVLEGFSDMEAHYEYGTAYDFTDGPPIYNNPGGSNFGLAQTWTSGFHTFTCIFSSVPQEITFYYDGVQLGEPLDESTLDGTVYVSPPTNLDLAKFLVLNNSYAQVPTLNTDMVVTYVRVWAGG